MLWTQIPLGILIAFLLSMIWLNPNMLDVPEDINSANQYRMSVILICIASILDLLGEPFWVISPAQHMFLLDLREILPLHSSSFGFFWQARRKDSREKNKIVLDSKHNLELIVPSTSFETWRNMNAFSDQVMIPNEIDRRMLIIVEITLPLK